MNITKYQAFIRVAELGNITKAAKELGYSQPGVSHMLDALEDEFGFPLLVRSREAVIPTEEGKKLLYYCYQIVKNEALLQETAASVKGLTSGTLHIGALHSTLINFVPKIVRGFCNTYSNIEVHLHEHNIETMKEQLKNGRIDVAFTTDNVPKGFSFLPLFEDPICLIVHRDHPFAVYDKVPVSVLNGCDFIMPIPGWDDSVKSVQERAPFVPNIKHYTEGDTTGIHLAEENLGVFIIAKLEANLLPANVVAKELDGNFTRTIGICTKSFRHGSPAVKEFIRISRGFQGQWIK